MNDYERNQSLDCGDLVPNKKNWLKRKKKKKGKKKKKQRRSSTSTEPLDYFQHSFYLSSFFSSSSSLSSSSSSFYHSNSQRFILPLLNSTKAYDFILPPLTESIALPPLEFSFTSLFE